MTDKPMIDVIAREVIELLGKKVFAQKATTGQCIFALVSVLHSLVQLDKEPGKLATLIAEEFTNLAL
jgi:hypothetical protein